MSETTQPRQEVAASMELVLVLTTEAGPSEAETLAQALLEQGLVACVSILPIVSFYRWHGQTTRSEEVQLLLKTHPRCLEALHHTVMDLHSYDTPEWITLRGLAHGSYGGWCLDQLMGTISKEGGSPLTPSTRSESEDPAG